MKIIDEIKQTLQCAVDIPKDKRTRFFKTGKGEYAHGDIFIGVRMPTLRIIAKRYAEISLNDIKILLQSPIHEERMLALIILVMQYEKGDNEGVIFDFYMRYIQHINNWDLVDVSAHYIVGAYLMDKDKSVLLKMVQSTTMWQRRIAIVSTWWFIRHDELEWTFKLGELLLNDEHDLMHKAVGWMLREAGKRDERQLRTFLDTYQQRMPRVMLRYAIEKFPEDVRRHYLTRVRKHKMPEIK
jgi:3-methyladenine DNA glycosylase AlkD